MFKSFDYFDNDEYENDWIGLMSIKKVKMTQIWKIWSIFNVRN